jgi:hypothetical protein
MDICIVRKVPFRITGTKRLVWAVVLAEREGVSLLFVQRPDELRSHLLIFATENVTERVYEEVKANQFTVEHDDLAGIGKILQALGEGISREDFSIFFKPNDGW